MATIQEESQQKCFHRTYLVVQWLRLCATSVGWGMWGIVRGWECVKRAGSIPGQGTKIPYAMQHGQRKKKKSERSVSMAKSFLFLEVYSLCLTLHHEFLALTHVGIFWKNFKKCYCL